MSAMSMWWLNTVPTQAQMILRHSHGWFTSTWNLTWQLFVRAETCSLNVWMYQTSKQSASEDCSDFEWEGVKTPTFFFDFHLHAQGPIITVICADCRARQSGFVTTARRPGSVTECHFFTDSVNRQQNVRWKNWWLHRLGTQVTSQVRNTCDLTS